MSLKQHNSARFNAFSKTHSGVYRSSAPQIRARISLGAQDSSLFVNDTPYIPGSNQTGSTHFEFVLEGWANKRPCMHVWAH